jgi:hypothetical protein
LANARDTGIQQPDGGEIGVVASGLVFWHLELEEESNVFRGVETICRIMLVMSYLASHEANGKLQGVGRRPSCWTVLHSPRFETNVAHGSRFDRRLRGHR